MIKKIFYKIQDLSSILGISLLVIVTISIVIHLILWKDITDIFWYCNLATILGGIGLLTKNSSYITAVLVTAIPGQSIWIIDFFLSVMGVGFGRIDWLFQSNFLIIVLSVTLHSVLIPCTFYGVYKYGFSRIGGIGGLIFFSVILLYATYFFTDPISNKNCVFYPCDMKLTSIDILYNGYYLNSLKYVLHNSLFWFMSGSISYIILYVFCSYHTKIRVVR